MNLKTLGACLIALLTFTVTPAYSQDEGQRASTGGAQTLEDILARQKGLNVDEAFRRENLGDPSKAAPISGNLGTLGGISNSDMYRGIRYSETEIKGIKQQPCSRGPGPGWWHGLVADTSGWYPVIRGIWRWWDHRATDRLLLHAR